MAGRVFQFRRGTTAQNARFKGAAGELTVDTVLNVLRLHDGTTVGGHLVGGGSSALVDGDYGDVLVGGSGTTMTVQSLGGVAAGQFATTSYVDAAVAGIDPGITGVAIRKNSGSVVGTRPQINFIAGTGIILTVTDDPATGEVDVTITVADTPPALPGDLGLVTDTPPADSFDLGTVTDAVSAFLDWGSV